MQGRAHCALDGVCRPAEGGAQRLSRAEVHGGGRVRDRVFLLHALCGQGSQYGKKLERWQRIAEEAAKQSGRGIIPQVRYEADFVAVLNDALHTDLPLFMYETGERETIRDAIEHTASPIASAAIITGPEGGFAEFEADMARKLGMHICSMGERILRCETAPVVALTALMYGTGNL